MSVLCLERQRLALTRGDAGKGRMKELAPRHIDTAHSEKFGQMDLERLIQHATKDLDELDRKREEQFKQYELRKEYQRRAKLAVNIFFQRIISELFLVHSCRK